MSSPSLVLLSSSSPSSTPVKEQQRVPQELAQVATATAVTASRDDDDDDDDKKNNDNSLSNTNINNTVDVGNVLMWLEQYEQAIMAGHETFNQCQWLLCTSRQTIQKRQESLTYKPSTAYCSAANIRAHGDLIPQFTLQYDDDDNHGIDDDPHHSTDTISSTKNVNDNSSKPTEEQEEKEKSSKQVRWFVLCGNGFPEEESADMVTSVEENQRSSSAAAPLQVVDKNVPGKGQPSLGKEDANHDWSQPHEGLRHRRRPPPAQLEEKRGEEDYDDEDQKKKKSHSAHNADKSDVGGTLDPTPPKQGVPRTPSSTAAKVVASSSSSSSPFVDPLVLLAGAFIPRELRQAQQQAQKAIQCYVHAANCQRQLQQALQHHQNHQEQGQQ